MPSKPLGRPVWRDASPASVALGRTDIALRDSPSIPMLLVLSPIDKLILSGNWTHLFFTGSWHASLHEITCKIDVVRRLAGALPGWPVEETLIWNHIGNDERHYAATEDSVLLASEHHRVTAVNCEGMANKIRSFANVLIHNPEYPDGARRGLEILVTNLSIWSNALRDSQNGIQQQAKYLHTARIIVECVRLSRFLKSGPEKFVDVIKRSPRLASPTGLYVALDSPATGLS